MKHVLQVVGAMALLGTMTGPDALAQETVYKCGARTYSQAPCAGRIISTKENPAGPQDPQEWHVQQTERRVVAQSMRRLPGESNAELNLRRHRARLSDSDRDECARLDTRIPFERQRLKDGVQDEEISESQESLIAAKKRFSALRC